MYELTDDLGIKSVSISFNGTELPSDSKLIGQLAMATLKALKINKDSVIVQDLLNELDIKIKP